MDVVSDQPAARAASAPDSVKRAEFRAVDLTRFAWLSIAAAIATISLKSAAWAMTGSVGLLSDAAEALAVGAFVTMETGAKSRMTS